MLPEAPVQRSLAQVFDKSGSYSRPPLGPRQNDGPVFSSSTPPSFGHCTRKAREVVRPIYLENVLGDAFDPTVDTFFYVLNEAQVACDRYTGAFADTTNCNPRPVLRLFLSLFSIVIHSLTFW